MTTVLNRGSGLLLAALLLGAEPAFAQAPATPQSSTQAPATPQSSTQAPATRQNSTQAPATPQNSTQAPATPQNSTQTQVQETPTIPAWGRVSFFAQSGTTTPTTGGGSSSYTELVTNLSAASAVGTGEGFDYGLNLRYAGYPSQSDRQSRTSIYDGWIGGRFLDGHLAVRFGQMWLNDLGSLGSVGGALVEYIEPGDGKTTNRWRGGAFYGVEPKVLDVGYMSSVSKYGAYVALESPDMRRHVLGYVSIHNHGLSERSVLALSNYLPLWRRLYVYQVAELDLSGPSGQGHGGLTYFFLNSRYVISSAVEIQGLFHRGRSVDVRSVTDDQLAGRPISPKVLEGFLYSSYGGRITVTVLKNLRVFGGYARDTNNRDDLATNRLTFGLFTFNLFGSGVDLNVTDNRMTRGSASSFDSWYVSLGRSLGARVYVTADYSTSLSVLHFARLDGVVIETRPNSKRFSASGMFNLWRLVTLQFTAEHTTADTYRENRFLAGLTFRF